MSFFNSSNCLFICKINIVIVIIVDECRASLIAQLVKNRLQCRRLRFYSWVRKIPWRRDGLPTLVFLGFPCVLTGKESACNMRDLCSIPGLGRSPGEGKGYPLQYSGLENSMDCIVHGGVKSWTWLSDFHFHFLPYFFLHRNSCFITFFVIQS